MLPFSCYCVLSVGVALFILRKLRETNWAKCNNSIKLPQKVVIVTGANSGIGYEIAKNLVERGAHVIFACRSLESAKQAISAIEKEVNGITSMFPMILDLASLKSVKQFAENIISTYKCVDILINNGGVSYPSNEMHITEDGFEVHFGVNYLSHFYLTTLLLKHFRKPARIVIVTSALYEKGTIDLNNLNNLHPNNKTNMYANSKLANVYFCRELSKRTKDTGITVYAASPGWVYTRLFRYSIKWYHYILAAPIAFFFMRTSWQGSQTPLYCATQPNIETETGSIYRDCQPYESGFELDDKISTLLWEKSEELIASAVKML